MLYVNFCNKLILFFPQVKFNRKFRQGELQVDSMNAARSKSTGNSRSLDIIPPFSVGGLSLEMQTEAAKNIEVTF